MIHIKTTYHSVKELCYETEQNLASPARCGGGSRLTPQGKEFLDKYAAYREQCTQACRGIYCQVFGGQR